MSPDTFAFNVRCLVKKGGDSAPRTLKLKDGIRLTFGLNGKVLTSVYCASLPTLLFGHNGRVIETQAEYQQALEVLKARVSKTAELPPYSEWDVSRIDLAWNFDLRVRPIILAYENTRIPGIRKGATIFDDSHGLSWLGSESRFGVKFYDKARKMKLEGSVLRGEITLRYEHLKRHFKKQEWREIDALRRVYREIMGGLPDISPPPQVKGWQEALALIPLEYRNIVYGALEPYVADRTFRRWRQRTAAAVARKLSLPSLRSLICADVSPPAVHLKPAKSRQRRE